MRFPLAILFVGGLSSDSGPALVIDTDFPATPDASTSPASKRSRTTLASPASAPSIGAPSPASKVQRASADRELKFAPPLAPSLATTPGAASASSSSHTVTVDAEGGAVDDVWSLLEQDGGGAGGGLSADTLPPLADDAPQIDAAPASNAPDAALACTEAELSEAAPDGNGSEANASAAGAEDGDDE